MSTRVAANVIIENCRIVDGSGAPARHGSVAIRGAAIDAVGPAEGPAAAERIDAEGLVLAPGFIDAHIHTDAVLLEEPVHLASLYQGVTTHIVGQDGFGFAPTGADTFRFIESYTAGINGSDVGLTPGTIGDYLARFDDATSVNVATLIPNGCVRLEALGDADARSASPAELERMADLCRAAMAEGALGLSSGLDYVPSCHASTDELIHLAAAVAEFGGVYVTHVRYRLGLLAALREAVEIGVQAGVPVHVSHLRAENGAGSTALLGLVDDACARGVEVTYDVYPYVCGCTILPCLLPAWLFDRSMDQVRSRLSDDAVRARLRHELGDELGSWSDVEIVGALADSRAPYVGLDLITAARAAARHPVDFVCDLLVDESFRVTVLVHPADAAAEEADLQRMLRHRAHTVGSDGIFTDGLLHPRGYGSFARFVGTLVRQGVLPLEEAIRHATGAPAGRFGLRDRGLIRPGFAADVVLFDPDALADRATYKDGAVLAEGVRDVFVNGVRVLEDGRPTGETPGRGLRRGVNC